MALKKRYRIYVVPPDTSEVKQFEVRAPRLGLLVFLAVCLLVGTVATSWITFRSSQDEFRYKAEIEKLREANQAQQFHIQRFTDRLGHMSQQMERLQDFHTKLKILADLDLQERVDTSMAAGGPDAQSPELNMYLEKNLKRQIRRIHWELEELQMQALIQEQNSYSVESFFDSQRSLLAATPTIWPVRGWVTSSFGQRVSPFTGEMQMHRGMDICARPGTPVKATANGVVIFSGWKTEYGKSVVLDHGYGLKTQYAHMSKIYVRNGKRIKRGTIVGTVGNTGRSTGPHLHYEVRLKNVAVNPKAYLLD